MKKILFILTLTLCFVTCEPKAFAQSFESISFVVTPQNPSPGDTVHVLLQSYSLNIDQSKITWYVNNRKSLDGTGQKELVTKIPTTGSAIVVRVVIVDKNNKTVDENITITPASLDLLWEATDSYTPAFYKGKALPGEESVVRVIAMPTSQDAIPKSKTNTYQWVRNGSNMPLVSGSGKDVYTIKLDPFNNSEKISVSSNSNQQDISIRPTASEVLLYEINPLYGIKYNKVLSEEVSLNAQEISLDAEPFFFSPINKHNDSLQYTWTLGGLPTQTGSDKTNFTLRAGSDSASSVSVGLQVTNSIRTLQNSLTKILLHFTHT